MIWGKKKKHASKEEIPAADTNHKELSALSGKMPPAALIHPAPGEYLDNPLPVPKRHVRKEMNYAFEPSPDQMFYETPVADNDDFDV